MKSMSVILLSCLCLGAVNAWSYSRSGSDGVSNWGTSHSICGLKQQSPINVVDEDTRCTKIEPIRLIGWDKQPTGMLISNNGHSISVAIDGDYNVTGGGLGATYKVEQFHFHWGADDSKGSEHTVDGRSYPLELHIVAYKTSYGAFGLAANKPDGLAVLGIFFDTMTVDTLADKPIPSVDNTALDSVLDYLDKTTHKENESSIDVFPLMDLAPRQAQLADFYRYNGSLTTPPCYESVTWTVFKWINYVSKAQMEKLRTMVFVNEVGETDVPIVDNFRPPQPLNGRIVWNTECTSSAQFLLPSVAMLMFSLWLLMC